MSPIAIRIGEKVLYKGKLCVITGVIDLSTIVVTDLELNTTFEVSLSELEPYSEIQENSSSLLPIDPESEESELWEEAKRRLEIIKPLLKSNRTKAEVKQRAKEYGVSPVTVYRWIKQYESSGGLLSSLIPDYKQRGGRGKKRLSPEIEELMNAVIKNVYLNPTRRVSVKRAYQEFLILCKDRGLEPPHENTFRNRIKELNPFKVVKKREGRVKAQGLYGTAEKPFEATYPLEVVQIDHTEVDIIIVDEISREPIGRPYITLAIDVYSRMVYGFYLSLERPSFFSVGQAILLGALRKETYLEELGVEGKWEIWGLPQTIHIDNAKEFRSKDFERFCEEYGITIKYRPRKTPHYGGHIERLIGTTNKEIHNLPGSTFSNTVQRGDYKPEKHAVFTLKEFEKWFAHLIVNIYHKRIHSELGMSPEEKFRIGILGDGKTFKGIGLPKLIAGEEAEKLRLALLPSFKRTIQKDGVHFEGIRYYSDILKPFIRHGEKANIKKKTYTFKYDPRDMRFVYFLHPEHKTYYKISCREKRLPRISIWELRTAKKSFNDTKKYREYELLEAIKKLFEIEKEVISKSKEVKRKFSSKKRHKEREEIERKMIEEVTEIRPSSPEVEIEMPNPEKDESLIDEFGDLDNIGRYEVD